MRKKIILMCAILCSLQIVATDLVIHKNPANSPTEHNTVGGILTFESQDIDLIGKLMFDGDYMRLYDKSGHLLASELIEEIRKIVFETPSIPTSIETVKTTTSILVYPNPTQDVIFIQGIEAQSLRIFNIEGKLVQEVYGSQVPVSHLSTGTYILQIGTQAVRFIKQ